MNTQVFDVLKDKAEEFGAIAEKVNESSRLRKTHSEEALKFIDQSIEIGEGLEGDFNSVAKTNSELRNQDNIVLNTCAILKSNLEKQNELIDELKKSNHVDPGIIEGCSLIIKNLMESIEEALSNVKTIISKDNAIILMDKQLVMRKQSQQSALKKLKEIATKSLNDAEKAINGSSSNLDRGLQMVEKLKGVKQLVSDNKIDELKNLLDEAKSGWNIAVDVNNSSKSQFKFAEEVKRFTQQLHRDSSSIKEMVVDKHNLFENNLQDITVLTVILSLKFKKYLKIEEDIEKMELKEELRELLNSLIINVKIACKDIIDISAMNYDMTDVSHLNNEIEDKAVKSTAKELEFYDTIKSKVESMTEATKYPVEGSGKNITNGQILEKSLKEIIDGIKI